MSCFLTDERLIEEMRNALPCSEGEATYYLSLAKTQLESQHESYGEADLVSLAINLYDQ